MNRKLIVGLGNPGRQYERTRHNTGIMAVRKWAGDKKWVKDDKIRGEVCEVEEGVIALFPWTFMNDSGISVAAAVKKYGVEVKNVLVVHDDVELEFGELKLREGGSARGHNGVKSIMTELAKDDFWRLRIGVGRREGVDLEKYVLERFSEEEERMLQKVWGESGKMIEEWVASF